MNDKRASRRICANCKGQWADSAMVKWGKRYICPRCSESKKKTSALRRARSKWPEEVVEQ